MSFGERLKRLRVEKGLSQQELADILKVNRATLGNWEIDRTSPGYTTLCKIAKYFNVTVDYLLNGEPLKVGEDGVPYIVMSPDEIELFAQIKQLSEEDKVMVKSLVEHLRRKKGVNEKAAGSDNIRPFSQKD